MEQKINEVNIENNLVFCIDPRKAFAIKSIPRSVFRNMSYKIKIRLFRLNLEFDFFIKPWRNRLCIWLISQERVDVCLLNSPLLQRSDDLSDKIEFHLSYFSELMEGEKEYGSRQKRYANSETLQKIRSLASTLVKMKVTHQLKQLEESKREQDSRADVKASVTSDRKRQISEKCTEKWQKI